MKVLMLGDSLTKYGLPEAVQGPLNELTKGKVVWTLINAGLGGEAAEEGKKRLPALLDEHKPDVLTVLYGANDLAKNYKPEEFRKQMNEISELAIAREHAPKVIFLTTTLCDPNRHSFGKDARLNAAGGANWVLDKDYMAGTRAVAADHRLPLIDLHRFHASVPDWTKYLVADGIHLSKGGYKAIGGYVAECMAGWYAAEIAKDPKAVKARADAESWLKDLYAQAPRASADEAARKALLAKFDEAWRACPWLANGAAAWHEARYRNATTQPRTRPAASPATSQPATRGTTQPALQPYSERQTQEIQTWLQNEFGEKLQELATKNRAFGATEVPVHLELDAKGEARKALVDLPAEEHAKFKARVELEILTKWSVPNPPRAGSCTVRLPIPKPPRKTSIFEVAPRD